MKNPFMKNFCLWEICINKTTKSENTMTLRVQ